MLRIVKIVLGVAVAAFGLISGIFDLINWHSTAASVGAVTSLIGVQGGAASWKAISSAPLSWLGALWIIAGDLTAAVLCTIGVACMWRARNASAAEFSTAKRLVLSGCGVFAIMLFGGFTVVAESWFELWRSDAMRDAVLGAAFRYLCSILLIALFVASAESEQRI